MFVSLVLFLVACALCVLFQLSQFAINLCWHWSNQEFLSWLNVHLILAHPRPKLWKCQSVLRIEFDQVGNDTSENLWIMLWIFPLVDQFSSFGLAKSKSFEIIDFRWVFENTCHQDSESNREEFRLLIFLITRGPKCKFLNILRSQ